MIARCLYRTTIAGFARGSGIAAFFFLSATTLAAQGFQPLPAYRPPAAPVSQSPFHSVPVLPAVPKTLAPAVPPPSYASGPTTPTMPSPPSPQPISPSTYGSSSGYGGYGYGYGYDYGYDYGYGYGSYGYGASTVSNEPPVLDSNFFNKISSDATRTSTDSEGRTLARQPNYSRAQRKEWIEDCAYLMDTGFDKFRDCFKSQKEQFEQKLRQSNQ